jgi:hypothetical protein
MPNIAIPDELQGKNWFAHALALTSCSVQKSSQYLAKALFTSITQSLESIAVNLPEHTPAAYLGTFQRFYDQALRPPL